MSSSASTTAATPVVGSWSCLSEHVPLKEATEKGHIKGRSSNAVSQRQRARTNEHLYVKGICAKGFLTHVSILFFLFFHQSGIVGDNLYVFSGENTPRVPIDNSLHVFNLSSKKWIELPKKDAQSWPIARIGHAGGTVGNAFYISGGRSGLDAGDVTLDDFWKYDTVSGTWTCLTDSTGTKPPPMSYHTMTSCGDSIFIFGGCTTDHGRSNGLYQYSTLTNTWSELSPVGSSSAPCARGGPGLAADDANVYVAFGYNGKEEQDDLWKFDRTNKSWTKVEPNGQKPTPRSVTDLVALKG